MHTHNLKHPPCFMYLTFCLHAPGRLLKAERGSCTELKKKKIFFFFFFILTPILCIFEWVAWLRTFFFTHKSRRSRLHTCVYLDLYLCIVFMCVWTQLEVTIWPFTALFPAVTIAQHELSHPHHLHPRPLPITIKQHSEHN